MARAAKSIEVFNRYSGKIEIEEVYGERWLRWTYETIVGRAALAMVVKRAWFSRWYGWRMRRAASAARIRPFVSHYGIATGEFADAIETFASFNDFFVRRLKSQARPVAADPEAIVFPADGRHLGFADAAVAGGFYAKGQSLELADLFRDSELARRHSHGAIVVSRLCPVDYHRFHFPCDGRGGNPRLINGSLFSVNPLALVRNVNHLTENRRMLTVLGDTPVGNVVMVEIGATCVGSIVQTAAPGAVRKGAEKGYFQFGGSCIVTVFEPGRVRLERDLAEQSLEGRELYARFGDQMARVLPAISEESQLSA